MAVETLTYSPMANGWSSRWSFEPDWMVGMNSRLYTWKDGSLYVHNSNQTRNEFYGTTYPSTITSVLNDAPTDRKMYKTLAVDSDHVWSAEIETELGSGAIAANEFNLKEGVWFAFIRRNDGDLDPHEISVQGLGVVYAYTYPNIELYSPYDTDGHISVGDALYKLDNTGALVFLANVAYHNQFIVMLDGVPTEPITANDFLVYSKNSVAESFGARGYHMVVTLTNTDTDQVEIYSLRSNVFKSFE
jgi:hypothetical protein